IRSGTFGESEVSILFVAICTGCNSANQHVTDPHSVCTFSLECTFICDAAPSVRSIVIHVHLVFKMLPGIGKVGAVAFAVCSLLIKVNGGIHSYDLSAERHNNMLEVCVAADSRRVTCEVDRFVVPLMDTHDGEVRCFADHNFNSLAEVC